MMKILDFEMCEDVANFLYDFSEHESLVKQLHLKQNLYVKMVMFAEFEKF